MIGNNAPTKLVAAMLGVALLATACGDDDGGGSAGGGSVEDWCNALSLSDEGDAIFESLATDDAATIETNMARIEGIVSDLVDASPPEIADEVSYLADYTRQLRGALADADYSVFDTDLSGLDQARLEQMQTALDDFTTRECGRPFGGDDDVADSGDTGDDDSTFDVGAGTIREQLVQQFVAIGLTQQEAECIADNVDPTDQGVLTGDETAILELFEACDISLSRLAELGG